MSTNWDDLRFFLTLVRTEKASAAARQLIAATPQPTDHPEVDVDDPRLLDANAAA